MNVTEIKMLGDDCYAAFNQKSPEAGSRAWPLWAEMCADIPVAASPFIRGKILELDSMPRNFGKAVSQYGREWKGGKTTGRFVFEACPDCDRETPGFFYVWEARSNGDLHRFIVRCQCNQGKSTHKMRQMTKKQAVAAGYEVIPNDFADGMPAFETQLMNLRLEEGVNEYVRAARQKRFRVRGAHRNALADAEII